MNTIMKRANSLSVAQQQHCDDALTWLRARGISAQSGQQLSSDSRQLNSGDVFVAYAFDANNDARDHAQAAIEKNPAAVLWQSGRAFDADLPHLAVENLNQYAGHIAHAYYQAPSDAMACIAITNSRMRAAGCDDGIEKRRVMWALICDPSPRRNRPSAKALRV